MRKILAYVYMPVFFAIVGYFLLYIALSPIRDTLVAAAKMVLVQTVPTFSTGLTDVFDDNIVYDDDGNVVSGGIKGDNNNDSNLVADLESKSEDEESENEELNSDSETETEEETFIDDEGNTVDTAGNVITYDEEGNKVKTDNEGNVTTIYKNGDVITTNTNGDVISTSTANVNNTNNSSSKNTNSANNNDSNGTNNTVNNNGGNTNNNSNNGNTATNNNSNGGDTNNNSNSGNTATNNNSNGGNTATNNNSNGGNTATNNNSNGGDTNNNSNSGNTNNNSNGGNTATNNNSNGGNTATNNNSNAGNTTTNNNSSENTAAPNLSKPTENTRYATLVCDRLGINVPLYFGDGDMALLYGAGQYAGSSLPGYGSPILIAGHNTTYFRALENVASGDIFKIQTNYGLYQYQVTATRIVADAEVDSAYSLSGGEELVLYTCYPFVTVTPGSKTQRMFVYASKISGPSMN